MEIESYSLSRYFVIKPTEVRKKDLMHSIKHAFINYQVNLGLAHVLNKVEKEKVHTEKKINVSQK